MKLEIGPGDKKISKEWITVGDFERPGVVDHICKWGKEKFPFENKTFDLIYASHCLEHVPWYEVDFALQECHRILKPGGYLEVHVPNLEYIVSCYINKTIGDKWEKYNNREHPVAWFASRLISYGPTLSNYHKSCFDNEYLKFVLTKNKFSNITTVEDSLAHKLHGPINMGVRATKEKI